MTAQVWPSKISAGLGENAGRDGAGGDPTTHPKHVGRNGSRVQLTQVGVVPPAELPAATKAQIKGLLIWASQLVPALNGSEGLLSIAIGDKAVVVPGSKKEMSMGTVTPSS